MEKLADILMRRSRKSFEKTTSEYTFYDDEGQQIYNSLLNLNIDEVSLHDVVTKNVFKGICAKLKSIFKQWIAEYDFLEDNAVKVPIPTEEDLAMMKYLREKGLIT